MPYRPWQPLSGLSALLWGGVEPGITCCHVPCSAVTVATASIQPPLDCPVEPCCQRLRWFCKPGSSVHCAVLGVCVRVGHRRQCPVEPAVGQQTRHSHSQNLTWLLLVCLRTQRQVQGRCLGWHGITSQASPQLCPDPPLLSPHSSQTKYARSLYRLSVYASELAWDVPPPPFFTWKVSSPLGV